MTQLSDFQRENLERLARYLVSVPQAEFDMAHYRSECGTVGCAAGHGPAAGIPLLKDESFNAYTPRVFGCSALVGYAPDELYSWLFHAGWTDSDNTPTGAAKRILYFIRHGLPANVWQQRVGFAQLCYLNEPLDPVTPTQPQPSVASEPAFVEAV